MKRKLLPHTLRVYVIFALAVLVTGAPFFYIITQWLYINDTNETLQLSKRNFVQTTLPGLKKKDLVAFNQLSWNIKIIDFEKRVTQDVFQERAFLDSLENEDETYRVLLSPITIENKPYTLLVRMNMIESGNLVESIAIVFVAIIAILLTGLYLITRKLSQRLWEPFYNSLAQIEAFKIDKNVIPRWQATDIEEFDRLHLAVNTLIERNLAIYISQKEFVENAAHELQTPLAVFQAKLDSLMQTQAITADQAAIIADLLNAATRLSKLNRNLLLLSKIDAGQFHSREDISISKSLEKQVQFFRDQAQARNIRIHSKIKDGLVVKVNPSLLESLLSNLLLNAIRHNYDTGDVMVELDHKQLTICNTGKARPLDQAVIFERFSKTNPSFSGSGLGLAIVKKIAQLFDWQIIYYWENEQHCFKLTFNTSFS